MGDGVDSNKRQGHELPLIRRYSSIIGSISKEVANEKSSSSAIASIFNFSVDGKVVLIVLLRLFKGEDIGAPDPLLNRSACSHRLAALGRGRRPIRAF